MLKDMDRVLEESGKWFLHVALAVVVTFLFQPISQGKLDLKTFILALLTTAVFFALGNLLLYLSKRVRRKDGI